MTLVPIPRARKRGRKYFMTARDQAAFSAALKLAYPDLVFGQIRDDRVLTYFASMEQVDNTLQDREGHAWRCPAGWEPDWALRYPDLPSIGYVVANLPDCHFYYRSSTTMGYHETGTGRRVRVPLRSSVYAVYDQSDPDTRQFIEKVYRLLRKFTTNKFLMVEPDSGRIVRQVSDYFQSAGHDVLLNCRKDKDHYVTACYFDEGRGERYFYAPTAEWLPPAWLVELDAKADAGTGRDDGATLRPPPDPAAAAR